MAIASLVIGIIFVAAIGVSRGLSTGILGLPFGFGILGSFQFALPASIIGLVLGIFAIRKKTKRGFAIAGIVLNAIVVLWFVAIMAVWATFGD